jgi:hypothetical protein
MADTSLVSIAVPIDILPALTHRPYNNPVLNAPGR